MAISVVLSIYASIKLYELDNFGDLKTLCDFKLCDCIVRKIIFNY